MKEYQQMKNKKASKASVVATDNSGMIIGPFRITYSSITWNKEQIAGLDYSNFQLKDTNGNVLAEDVVSYNVIAYLDPSRSENSDKPLHVVDVDATAEKLAPYVNLDVSVLKHLQEYLKDRHVIVD